MRAFSQNLAVKTISFIFFVLLIFSLFVSVLGVYFMIESNVYIDGGEQMIESIYESYDLEWHSLVENMLNDKFGGYRGSYYEEKLNPENSNFRYTAVDSKGITQSTNIYSGDEIVYMREVTINLFVPVDEVIYTDYLVFGNYGELYECLNEFEGDDRRIESNEIGERSDGVWLKVKYRKGEYQNITVSSGVLKEPIVKDIFYYELKLADFAISVRETVFIYIAVAVILSVFLFIVLMCGAGRKKGHEGIYLFKFHKIPFDLYLVLNVIAVSIAAGFIDEISYSRFGGIISFCFAIPVFTVMALGIFMTFAARIKAGGWYKNTIIYFCIKWLIIAIKVLFKGLVFVVSKTPLFYKTLCLIIAVTAVEVLFLAFGLEDFLLLWIIEKLIFIPLTVYAVLCMKNLQKSAKMLSQGNSEYKTDTKYMLLDFKEHGEYLNGIGNGLALAVEKSVKSERMKAELITNVSHDIKTPLTSIINYVDLLKREGVGSENASEYISVLDRQSHRLKRLTEDLVEASKASTGNITINFEKTDINVLLTQTAGEYEEKLAEKDLSLVLDIAEEELVVNADGRHMWRVFDNLMNNICKYAQPKTRVYLSAYKENGKVVTVFRNISKESLNIEPEELTERFVRGDRSRNTEGSGLGLSIAKSLTELQGGTFDVKIDGDLFKVTITI